MERFATSELDKWINSSNRKPLVIRGARQVGKTWLVRYLAKHHNLKRLDLNPPSVQKINMKTTKGEPVSYDLLSFPLYLAERIAPLISNYLNNL